MQLCSIRNIPRFWLNTIISFILCNFGELLGLKPLYTFAVSHLGLCAEISFRAADLLCHGYNQGVMQLCSIRNAPRFWLNTTISFIVCNFFKLLGLKPACTFAVSDLGLWAEISFRAAYLLCHGYSQGGMQLCSIRNVPRFWLNTAISFILWNYVKLLGLKPAYTFAVSHLGLWAEISFRAAHLLWHVDSQGVMQLCSIRNVPRFLLNTAISFILSV